MLRLRIAEDLRDVDGEARALADLAVEVDAALQPVGHEIVDDVQAEASSPGASAGGEEGIEHLADVVLRDASPVVAENDPHGFGPGLADTDREPPALPLVIGMGNGIGEQVRQHLAEGAWIGV